MNIPNLKNMNPADRAELQAFCNEVIRFINRINLGVFDVRDGKQVIGTRPATVGSGLVTRSQLDVNLTDTENFVLRNIQSAVDKLKQDNDLV